MNTQISITIPVLNEVDNVKLVYNSLVQVLTVLNKTWEIIFVNDGSSDSSGQILNELADSDVRVKVVHFPRNFGQTAAMMAGVQYAQGEIIIPMDADLQNDPIDIPKLLEKIDQGYDVVSGWRRDRKDHALKRNLVSRLANWLISVISGVHLHDYGCSLKAYKKEIIKGVRLYGEMHRFIPIYASWFGARIVEIPVTHHPRRHGISNYGLERIIKVLFDLVVVKFLVRYAEKPMYIFGAVGSASLGVAFISGMWAVYLKIFEHTSFIQTPLPLLVVLTTITGVMCFLMGLLAELVIRTYYESQSKKIYIVSETRNIEGM